MGCYLYDADVAEFALLEVVRVVIRHDVRVLQFSHDTETIIPDTQNVTSVARLCWRQSHYMLRSGRHSHNIIVMMESAPG